MRLILGSSSKFRRSILASMGYEFEVISPDIDEKSIRHHDPDQLVLELARAKAASILKRLNGLAIVISSDQVVVCAGRIHEKPRGAQEVRRLYAKFALHPVETVTSVMVTNSLSGQQVSGIDRVKTDLLPVPDSIVEQLIKEGEVYNCAGGVRFEDPLLAPYIKEVKGTLESTMGLPRALTERLLKTAGYHLATRRHSS